jgi:hypothetical protein
MAETKPLHYGGNLGKVPIISPPTEAGMDIRSKSQLLLAATTLADEFFCF